MITSVKNEKVKQWRKLKQKKERDKRSLFMIEGFHLVEEALQSDWQIKEVIIEDGIDKSHSLEGYSVYEVAENVMAAITDTKSPQGIVAVVEKKYVTPTDFSRVLLMDQVQDPGNLGTMIRTADAAGFDAVILGEGTVDLYNEKVIRATQGSLFHLDILEANLSEEIRHLQDRDVKVWATGLENAERYDQLEIPEKLAVIVGNEGAGVDPKLMDQSDQIVTIPIYGRAESLNVSVAAGILMYAVAKTQ
ncbi:RNA methyltransferase [Gracilibacillus sp. YIM 98692]|uniref:TrmH family RNA methyltransferase n=1 Tax=Gracilibacillus sp. YIM 98692 TaxID=2663532 RepID=UPI001969CE51|nr:RNA methyltransferase [Gracilibacillus sp. YIM 98692]